MSVRNTLAEGDLSLFTNACVDAEVAITLHMQAPDHEIVSILFGQERITLEFYDVASLERLRDVAGEGARLLAEALQANAHEGDPAASAD